MVPTTIIEMATKATRFVVSLFVFEFDIAAFFIW